VQKAVVSARNLADAAAGIVQVRRAALRTVRARGSRSIELQELR